MSLARISICCSPCAICSAPSLPTLRMQGKVGIMMFSMTYPHTLLSMFIIC